MTYRKWTDSQLEIAVKNSHTISEVVRKIGLKSQNSGNHQSVRNRIKALNISTSHFFESYAGRNFTKERGLSDILVKDSTYLNTVALKKKLIKYGVLSYKCYECGITYWQHRKLSLHLDHINGIREDNRIENLRLLCPNCHSLTETYCRGANRLRKRCSCGKNICRKSKKCLECYWKEKQISNSQCKIKWPPLDTLIKMVGESNYLQVAKKLGVSDNAVRKRIKTRQKLSNPPSP